MKIKNIIYYYIYLHLLLVSLIMSQQTHSIMKIIGVEYIADRLQLYQLLILIKGKINKMNEILSYTKYDLIKINLKAQLGTS